MKEKKELNLIADIRGSVITDEIIKSNEIYNKGYIPYYARRRMDKYEGDVEEVVNELSIKIEYVSLRSYKNRTICSRHHLYRLMKFVETIQEDTVENRTLKYMGKEIIMYYFCNIVKSKVLISRKRTVVVVNTDDNYYGIDPLEMINELNRNIGSNDTISEIINLIMSLDTTDDEFKNLLAGFLIVGGDTFVNILGGNSIIERIITYIFIDSKPESKIDNCDTLMRKYPEECTVAATLLTRSHCGAYVIDNIPPKIIGNNAKRLIKGGYDIFSTKLSDKAYEKRFKDICDACIEAGDMKPSDVEMQILKCPKKLPVECLTGKKLNGIVTQAVIRNYKGIKSMTESLIESIRTDMSLAYAMCNVLDNYRTMYDADTDTKCIAITGKLLDIVIDNISTEPNGITGIVINRVMGFVRNTNRHFWGIENNMSKIYRILTDKSSCYSEIVMEAISTNSLSHALQSAFQVSNETLELCYKKTGNIEAVLSMANMYVNFEFIRDNYGKMFMELPATVSFSMYVHMYDENGFHRGVMGTDDRKNVFQWIKQHLSKDNISQLIFSPVVMKSNKEFFADLVKVHNVDRYIDVYGINFVEELTDISISDLVRSGSYAHCGDSTFVRYLDIVLLDDDLRKIILNDDIALSMFNGEILESVLNCYTFSNSIKCDVLYHLIDYPGAISRTFDDIKDYLYGSGSCGYRLLALIGNNSTDMEEKAQIYEAITSGIVELEEDD